MIFRIRNIEKDEFIALVLEEAVHDLKNMEEENSIVLEEIINEDNHAKGLEIQEIAVLVQETWEAISPQVETIILGLISAGVWDVLKNIVRKFKKLSEYDSSKVIEIEQEDKDGQKFRVKITVDEILNK